MQGGICINQGKIFETNWRKSIPDNVYYVRIKDSPSSFSQDSGSVRFTLNNPYDSFIFYNGRLFPIELKSTQGTSISIQRDKSEKGKMIKLHQIEGLFKASLYDGIKAGFLFDFRSSEHTYWLDIVDFKRFIDSCEKKSINENDVINFGGVKINKRKKKIHYVYEVLELLKVI